MATMTPDQIRGELRCRRMTQIDVARRLGVTQSWVSQVLSGDLKPGPEAKARLESTIGELLRTTPVSTDKIGVVFEIPTNETES
jgi:transcriptional regulator with XRE-family HTH domain